MKEKIILDCDPGHDDAIALLLAAHHPQLELLAVTTVAGNQAVEKTSRNALKVCSLAGLHHIPVARGMEKPLVRAPGFAADIHGETGLDGPDIPEPVMSLVSMHAVDLLIDLLLRAEEPITLVATGPLTNIATALEREPHIARNIKAISIMGGAIGLGNVTPAAEFNIWFDPEAAQKVFQCGRPITMIPLEVTHQALATKEIMRRLRSSGRRVANFAADLLAFFADTYEQVFGFSAPPVHDPCAVAAVIDPAIIEGHDIRVEIETGGEWSAGRTICDVYGKIQLPPNARVGYSLNVPHFWDLTINTILTYE
ncbi:nucleoside hydrolase [Ktedonobacter racemifer]|uniref:Uridine nucleosidase n=1 Tax=Ktedonobacter racemifer DSM 44963 TaxID=485913 RepID=D6TNU0_KTERA|nr:nucleoside hydrolase [Ktedonobacter racemifer]EFH85476.1 Uridine nucleosidase [Ktedonobacter racemifer DSM 44963]